MYCTYCGKANYPDAMFCAGCGQQLKGVPTGAPVQAVDHQAQKEAKRQSEIAALWETRQYFDRARELFAEYNAATKLLLKFGEGAKSALLVLGCVFSGVALIILLVAVAVISADPGAEEYLWHPVVGILLPAVCMLFGGIAMKANGRKQFAIYRNQYIAITQRLYSYYTHCPNCQVRPEHCNPEVLDLFIDCLRSGKVDTIQESINKVIKDADQGDMEDYFEDIADCLSDCEAKNLPIFAVAKTFDP